MNVASRLSAAAIAASLAFAAPASAQVTFTGFTNGCFYAFGGSCVPENTPGAATDALGQLVYTNSTFNVQSFAGVAAIGETNTLPNINNLGSISIPSGAANQDFTNQRFNLNVFFTAPASAVPTNSTFMATLTGGISNNAGAVNFDFDNAPRVFAYNGGTYTLQVNDVSLTNTGAVNSIALSGFITVNQTAVPEPSTYLLMASGLAGLAFFGKRRRNNV